MASMPIYFPPNPQANPQAPPGNPTKGAGLEPQAPAPASGPKAKKPPRRFCTVCRKANHTADVCRNKPGNVLIVSGGSSLTPPGTILNVGVSAGVSKKKKKKAKKAKKEEAALAKAVEDVVMSNK